MQSLLLIATMVVLGGALLTSTLVSTKAALHQAVIRKSQTAISDATAQFVAWAQNYVTRYGTEAPWPRGIQPQSGPIHEDLCSGKIMPSAMPASESCPLIATLRWKITGSSAGSTQQSPQNGVTSIAQNLSVSLDEQRISATLSVAISNPSGTTVFATHSREVTARIFDAAPYVAVTATRDVSAEVADIHTSEGDTGGALPYGFTPKAPTALSPAQFTDTRLRTTIDCHNSAQNNDQGDPLADGINVPFDRTTRPYGNVAWVFEAPCAPNYYIDTREAPSDYSPPDNSTYATNASSSIPWRKSDENTSPYSL